MRFRNSRKFVPADGVRSLLPNVQTFKLISYNILGDGPNLALSPHHDYCPLKFREFLEYRLPKLFDELIRYRADIICLQEVQLGHFNTSMRAKFDEMGYDCVLMREFANQAKRELDDITGNAILVKRKKFTILNSSAELFRDLLDPTRHAGRLKKKLLSLDDGVMYVHLRDNNTEKELVVGNTHLHYDPKYPHVKACQAEIALSCLGKFSGGFQLPLVFAGDFNSVHFLQRGFLAEKQRQDVDENYSSAVFKLLKTGKVDPSSLEHPDRFGKSLEEYEQVLEKKRKCLLRNKKFKQILCGDLTGPGLLDAYDTRETLLTTKVPHFCGRIDYIWHSKRLNLQSVLDLPYTSDNYVDFPCIPNEEFPSDHIAIGAQMSFN